MANACFAVRAFGLVLDGRGAMSGLLPLQPSTRDGFRALDGRLTGRSTNVPTRREESATEPRDRRWSMNQVGFRLVVQS